MRYTALTYSFSYLEPVCAPWEKNLNKSIYTYMCNLFTIQQKLPFIALQINYTELKIKNELKINQRSGINHNHMYNSFQWVLRVLAEYGT